LPFISVANKLIGNGYKWQLIQTLVFAYFLIGRLFISSSLTQLKQEYYLLDFLVAYFMRLFST